MSILNGIWFSWLTGGEIQALLMGLFLWPLFALISLVLWFGEILHIISKRRKAADNANELKRATKYSHMSMEELIAEQKKVLSDTQFLNSKNKVHPEAPTSQLPPL